MTLYFTHFLIMYGFGSVVGNQDISWSSDIILAYYKSKDIHCIDAIVCNRKDGMSIIRSLSKSPYSNYIMLLRVIANWDSEENNINPLGVFVDLSCEQNRRLIHNATPRWFRSTYSWLIWDNERYFEQSSIESMSTYSDVVINVQNQFYQIYHYSETSPTHSQLIGNWDESTGNLEIVISKLKPNYHLSVIKAGIFAMQDIYDKDSVIMARQLIDVSFQPSVDPSNRFFYTLLHNMANSFNFSLTVVRGFAWGTRYPNGTWDGLIGLLKSFEADVTVTPLYPVSERIDVSYAIPSLQRYWFALIFKQPRSLGTYKAMTLEFSPSVWCCLGILIISGAITFAVTMRHSILKDETFDLALLQSVGIFANQGLSLLPRRIAPRIVCLSLLITALLVSTCYNAATMSALLAESPPTIKSVSEVVDYNIQINLLESPYFSTPYYRHRVLGPKTFKHTERNLQILSLQDGLKTILEGEAFCAEYYTLYEGIDSHYKDDEKCYLTVLPITPLYPGMRYIKKDMHLLEMFTSGSIKLLEHGIVRKERDFWIKGRPICNQGIPFIHVKFESITVALSAYLVGLILSIHILIFECISKRWQQRRHVDNANAVQFQSRGQHCI